MNIPDDVLNHPCAPWNELEWHCPECGGHENDVECDGVYCEEDYCFLCQNYNDDCECE